MNITRFMPQILLLATFVWITGCATPDPLAGWKVNFHYQPDPAIVNDYQDYIQKLPSKEKYYVQDYDISFFEDGTGQHAVKIEIAFDGVTREHILIYDKDNKRIKIIKYLSGHYLS